LIMAKRSFASRLVGFVAVWCAVVMVHVVRSDAGVADNAGSAAPTSPAATSDVADAVATQVQVAAMPVRLDDCKTSATAVVEVQTDAPPVLWTQWQLVGKLADSPEVARALFDPYLKAHHAITASVRADLTEMAKVAGYHLLGLGTRELPSGDVVASVAVMPLPLVRQVNLKMDQSFLEPLLDQEVKRRMQLRVGAHIGWSPMVRKCETLFEQRRIEEFLREEGYFDAKVTVRVSVEDDNGAFVDVAIELGAPYELGKISIERGGTEAVKDNEIRDIFQHKGNCAFFVLCLGKARFTRSQHQADIRNITNLFHRRGFPAVRVQSDYDPDRNSFDRVRKTVNFSLRIDERRQLDIVFEGNDPERTPDDKLRNELTFDAAGSLDDIEAQSSAEKITQYLQTRGYFDARVTWIRKRDVLLDRITFRIELGDTRRVKDIVFVGNQALDDGTLSDAIGTSVYSRYRDVFSENPAPTAAQLLDDTERIRTTYRKAGYRSAQVQVTAAPTVDGLPNTGHALADLALDRGVGSLAVAFRIDEGILSTLDQIEFEISVGDGVADLRNPEARALCDSATTIAIATMNAAQRSGRNARLSAITVDRASPQHCVISVANAAFQEDVISSIPTQLLELLQQQGRRNAKVDYESVERSPGHWTASVKLTNLSRQRFGKIVLRGNFRTAGWVIRHELGFEEGKLLSNEQLAAGATRLRSTGLFDAVRIDFIDSAGDRNVNAIIRVEERFEKRFRGDVEGGYSFINGGLFVKGTGTIGNLFGVGINSQATVQARICSTLTFDCFSQAELAFKIPHWLLPSFDGEVAALYRALPSPRFGFLRTKGITFSASKSWLRPRTDNKPARNITLGGRFDFRIRDRQENALRPAGADSDQARLPVSTRTGALVARMEWEQRVDRRGALAPLAPEGGFRLEASLTLASPYLLGQATFVKASAAWQGYKLISNSFVMRADLRYDHGFPLGGAALLPDVERFFSGGDTSVRGFSEDSLATEVSSSAVPPFGMLQQIQVRPAGGNIRALASLDAQIRITGPVSSALFVDTGMVTNRWRDVDVQSVRTGVGMALVRFVSSVGTLAIEYAVPIAPRLGEDPRGRWHLGFAMRF
jgi:outer membrane protein insertion porin family